MEIQLWTFAFIHFFATLMHKRIYLGEPRQMKWFGRCFMYLLVRAIFSMTQISTTGVSGKSIIQSSVLTLTVIFSSKVRLTICHRVQGFSIEVIGYLWTFKCLKLEGCVWQRSTKQLVFAHQPQLSTPLVRATIKLCPWEDFPTAHLPEVPRSKAPVRTVASIEVTVTRRQW